MRVVHFVAMLSETAQMLRSLKTMEHSEVNMQDLGAYLEESTGVMSKSWLNLEALAFDIDNLADWTSMWARVAIKAKQMHGSIFLGERTSEDWEMGVVHVGEARQQDEQATTSESVEHA